MEFRKMVTMTLNVRKQKRHRCKEQSFGLWGRRQGWDDLRWEGGSRWGTHAHPWLIHVNVWQKPLRYWKVISLWLKHGSEVKVSASNAGDPGSTPKEMVTHSSILAWRIPWTEKPGRLQSTGSQRGGHSWVTSLSFFL